MPSHSAHLFGSVAFRRPPCYLIAAAAFRRVFPAWAARRCCRRPCAAGRPRSLLLLLFFSSFFPLTSRTAASPALIHHPRFGSTLASSRNNIVFDAVRAFEGVDCRRHFPVPRKFEVPPNPNCSGCILERCSSEPVLAILASSFDLPPFAERLQRPSLKPCFGYFLVPITYTPPVRTTLPSY